MGDGALRRLGLGLLVTVVLVLIALNVMAWTGGLVDEESSPQPVSAPPPGEPVLVLPDA